MTEVVGAVAAVVQFVDVALRLSSCLERFCSDVRNVPRRFVQLQTDLRQQIEIAQQIQNHRLPGFATAVASSTFDTPLAEYIDLADELCKTLEGLLGRQNDGVLRRGWDAICSVRKKEEVASICDRLEQKKSTLSLWLEAANLKLTSSIAATTDQTRLDVGDTLTLINTVDNTTNSIATNTAQLLPHIEQIDRTIATTSITTEHILHDTQRLLRGYDADVLTRESSYKSTAMILANTEQIMAAIEKLTRSPGKNSPHAQPGYVMDHMYVGSSASQQIQQSTLSHRRRPQRCKCRTVNTARRWQPLSILRFTRTFRTQHFSYCPDYRNSEQSLEVTMQIVPPSWLLCHTIDFGTHVRNWSTLNPFSISPIIVGTSRLVDSKKSPAVRAIEHTKAELRMARLDTRRHDMLVSRLQDTLQRLFDDGEASVLDAETDGRTILNRVVGLFICDYEPTCGIAEYTALFQCLLEKGADPNVIKDANSFIITDVPMHSGGTTCDQLMGPMFFDLSYGPSSVPRLQTVLELLVNAEGHTSKPFVGHRGAGRRCIGFREEVMQLKLFKDQLDVMDLGSLVPIILERQESCFQRCIQTDGLSILNRRSPVNGLAPIHFAVLWPAGLKKLVQREVDVNIEDDFCRRPIHLAVALGLTESVQCLLDADCGLFTPADDLSLFQYALNSPYEEQMSGMMLRLTRALADRHTRLINLANRSLPPSVFDKLGLATSGIQEQRAPLIIQKLVSHGIDIPPALELDGKGLYGAPQSAYVNVHMGRYAANALWSAGFQNIDEPDKYGCTPYLESWLHHNFEMVDWFASRDVRLGSRHVNFPLTTLHFFVKRIFWLDTGSMEEDTNMTILKKHYIATTQEELGIPYDDCTCACSPKGCTPAKLLLEEDRGWRHSSQRVLIRKCIKHLNPPKPIFDLYIYHFTRTILFEFIGGEHTCCLSRAKLWWESHLEKHQRAKSWRKTFGSFNDVPGEHYQCCKNGIPVPRRESLRALKNPDVFSATLNSAMSHYDEMDRPGTMPVEEQVFEYINWILKEGYLDIDVSDGCEHDPDVLREALPIYI